ncbi:hypothetical protein DRN38_07575, partial [Thermococci archaeon]
MAVKIFEADPVLLQGFIDDSLDELESLNSLFVKLETQPDNIDIVSEIFRPIHSIKGNVAFFGFMQVKTLAHEMETLLDMLRKEQLRPNKLIIDVLLEGVDHLKIMLVRTRDGHSEVADQTGFEKLVEKVVAAKESEEHVGHLLSGLYDSLVKFKTNCSELESLHIQEL